MSIATATRAAVLAILSVAASYVAADGAMSAAEIARTFPGIVLDGVYNDGSFFSETYFDDGSLRYRDAAGADSGDWSVEGDLFCTFYEKRQGACFIVMRDGDNCFTFFEPMRGPDGEIVPRQTWTSRGWNRGAEATCAEPPEAAT